MTVLPITCDNCGAKYKLPPSFTGAQAKCQKCGSVIDVARQRASAGGSDAPAAAKPAAAKPAAAARPAVDRSKPAAKEPAKAAAPERASKPTRSTRSSSRTAKAAKTTDEADGGDEATPRRGARAAKKGNMMPLVVSGIGVVAIGIVVFLMFGGDDKPKADAAAKADKTPAATAPAEKPVEKPAEKPVEKPAEPAPGKPAEPEAPKADAPPPAAATPKEASTPPPAAEPDDPTREKKPWEKLRNPPQTMDQVTDPKSYAEVVWPAEIDAAKKAELQALAEEAATDTGLRGIRAMKALAENGYGAMFAIVERLRLLNYMSTEESMTAFALNKVMEEITGGMTASFQPVEASETLVPAKAEWNTMSVKGWLGLLAKFPDSESFKQARAERLKKQAEANK
jgi:hypothetical protein